jgi:hypothetical protein
MQLSHRSLACLTIFYHIHYILFIISNNSIREQKARPIASNQAGGSFYAHVWTYKEGTA